MGRTCPDVFGGSGVICENDEYFYTQVGEDPKHFDYRRELRDEARQWNYERFKQAVDTGRSPIVVDRGNGLSPEFQRYARYAVNHDYDVELREPESEWWQEIRVLLKYKTYTHPILDQWSGELTRRSRETHCVPTDVIRCRIDKWKWDLTIDDILNF